MWGLPAGCGVETSRPPDPLGALVNVTVGLSTVLVAYAAIVIGSVVYQWTAPAADAPVPTLKGERLLWAVTAAAAVIAIGSFVASGINSEMPVEPHPSSTSLPRDGS
ncbi:putative membrane protein YeaQ/YmgE (transglycosylase-associated protein family) [Streptomyces umbrinus]|uniref:Membrane protein YeaQ/YmgE (Transglycosylase-associated protein family) n=1 Tax=Streptomyces umbrinus TaxID=67370 RepID=A0ABU0SG26_9ACTN|nr:putative membrane protein YeaQ/YmgE (transglycosylase-associated protein family) [Streptomyces umbrinus]